MQFAKDDCFLGGGGGALMKRDNLVDMTQQDWHRSGSTMSPWHVGLKQLLQTYEGRKKQLLSCLALDPLSASAVKLEGIPSTWQQGRALGSMRAGTVGGACEGFVMAMGGMRIKVEGVSHTSLEPVGGRHVELTWIGYGTMAVVGGVGSADCRKKQAGELNSSGSRARA